MRQNLRPMIVLDCPYAAWRADRRRERAVCRPSAPASPPEERLFTFDDAPSALLGEEQGMILKPFGGVKS